MMTIGKLTDKVQSVIDKSGLGLERKWKMGRILFKSFQVYGCRRIRRNGNLVGENVQ